MTWPLQVARSTCGDGICLIRLAGRIGTRESGNLIDALVGAMDEGDRRLIVDLSGVDYISSAGLLALDAVAGKAFASGATFVICGLGEPVRLAFELAGLIEHFSIEASAAEAAAKLPPAR